MNPAIQMDGLSKRFGKKDAVKNLTLSVPTGSIFAFLGPNGAGKTTTIKMLMNIIPPSAGGSAVLGVNSLSLEPPEFSQIGYVSENQKIPEWMTVGQLIEFCKPMYPTWDDAFCEQLLQQFGLKREEKIRRLSRGNKVKVSLLSSLAYRPKLLVLDEPFSGLDPLVRDEFIRGMLEMTRQENWTIFISSHDIDEVERLANWVGIINNGELHLAEAIGSLRERFRQMEVVAHEPAQKPPEIPPTWLNLEMADRTVRYVDSQFAEESGEAQVRATFPSAVSVSAAPMSLREIFLALARSFRINP